ncbi:hypothetical protein [Demetria terragena]|uniref:hypothetical protein n=1 Tax=Demetria terragena TaxID=63959 RepID=UPI0003756522|nr:hypothetical protein [Demetria terragena]
MIRRPAISTSATRTGAAIAATAVAIGLSGCAELSEQTTDLAYEPADGVSAKVGGVLLQDVLLIASEDGKEPAKLAGLAANPTGKPVKITVGTSAEGGTAFTVPARSTVRLDGKAGGPSSDRIKAITFPKISGEPGESAGLAFTTPSAGQIVVNTPVLLNQFPYGTHTAKHDHAEGEEGAGGH